MVFSFFLINEMECVFTIRYQNALSMLIIIADSYSSSKSNKEALEGCLSGFKQFFPVFIMNLLWTGYRHLRTSFLHFCAPSAFPYYFICILYLKYTLNYSDSGVNVRYGYVSDMSMLNFLFYVFPYSWRTIPSITMSEYVLNTGVHTENEELEHISSPLELSSYHANCVLG